MTIPEKIYSNDFFYALNAWQNGWREDQDKRLTLASDLYNESKNIPDKHRQVDSGCYRKVFLIKGDMTELFLKNGKFEGITSWTTSEQIAMDFKGVWRENAICAAIFKHQPKNDEVILNIPSLWAAPEFVSELASYSGDKSAINNFKDSQFEIVANAPLINQEIVFLSGVSSSFEDLCALANITDTKTIDEAWNVLISQNMQPQCPVYINQKRAQIVVENVKARFKKFIH